MRPNLARLRADFPQFLEERMPILVEFAKALDAQQPHRILKEPHLFLPGISDWLSHQEVSTQDQSWLVTRIGYLVGELLVTQYSGAWFLNEIEGSKYFGHYVVGQFASLSNRRLQVDPFEVAKEAVSSKATSLSALAAEVCHALEAAPAC